MKVTPYNQQNERIYSPSEHVVWSKLFNQLAHCRATLAHPFFVEGIEALKITADQVPHLKDINSKLMKISGWKGVPVKGLEGPESFYAGLARREFPIGNFIRKMDDINYTPEPDVFHDLYGHLPFFTNEKYADFCQAFGKSALKWVIDDESNAKYERLFWFGIEFSLIKTIHGKKIFGGGILSSLGESNYSMSSEPNVHPFDVHSVCARSFKIDEMQRDIYILESPDQLYDSLKELEKLVSL